jgi:hypothetical protein
MKETKGVLLKDVVDSLGAILTKYVFFKKVYVVPLTVRGDSQASSYYGTIGHIEIGRGEARIVLDSDDLVALGVVIDISKRLVRSRYTDDIWHIKAFAVARDCKTVRSCYYLLDGKLKNMDLVSCITCALKDLEDLQKFRVAIGEVNGDFRELVDITNVKGDSRGKELGTCL